MEKVNAGRVDARTGRKLEEIKIHKENNLRSPQWLGPGEVW